MTEELKRIKKSVIREDLVAITGNMCEAVILNQFWYWSQRISDADILIEKENEIARRNGEEEKEPFYGWIYKTVEEMADETMLGLSIKQTRVHIKRLVEKGFLLERHNPKYKWDRTIQYKINLVNIARALMENGYPLSDYRIEMPETLENMHFTFLPHGKDEKVKSNRKKMDVQTSEKVKAIPYITTKTTNTDITSIDSDDRVETLKGHNDIDFGIVKNQIEKACKKLELTNYFEELQEVILYYFQKYEETFGEEHPHLKQANMEKVVSTLVNGTDVAFDLCQDEFYKDLIDKHFQTQYRGCDYNICHFVSEGVVNNRYYETYF